MKKVAHIITYLLFLIILAASCNQESKKEEKIITPKKAKSLNPNGDSELALLMRGMYEEAENIREQIKKGEKVSITLDHGKILTAHATEAEKAERAEFKAFGAAYLENLNKLETADSSEVITIYQNMISNCMSCHQALCPGPIVRIKKLQKPIKI